MRRRKAQGAVGAEAKHFFADGVSILLEQDKETVPTDESETLVYYFLGRLRIGEIPKVEQVQEVHEKDGKIWLGPTLENKISVFTLLSLSGRAADKHVTRDSASAPPGLPENVVFDLARFVAQMRLNEAEE